MNHLPDWLDGRLRSPGEAQANAEGSDALFGEACYTTARVCAGKAVHAERHVERLLRDSRALGFDPPGERMILAAFAELGAAAFGKNTGIVRLEARCDARGATHLHATARHLGDEAAHWHAFVFPAPHPGPGPWPGVKRAADPYLDAARAHLSECGLDEAILLDRDGYVVEGARSSFVLRNAGGELVTPDPDRGGVRSIAREVVCTAIPEIRRRSISVASLLSAREVVAINAVRGAKPIQTLDGRPTGTSPMGELAEAMARALNAA